MNATVIAVIGLAGLLALSGRPRRSAGGAAAPAPPSREPPAAHRAYVDSLYELQREHLAAWRAVWGLDALRTLAQTVAATLTEAGYPVDPRQLWGLQLRESRWLPIGVEGFYADPPLPAALPPAYAYPSTSFGMSQILRSRWENSELPWMDEHLPELAFLEHWMLGWPRLNMWATGASLARLADKLKRAPTDLEVGYWWAGSSNHAGAEAKAQTIGDFGPLVFQRGPVSVPGYNVRNVPGPPADAARLDVPTPDDWWY